MIFLDVLRYMEGILRVPVKSGSGSLDFRTNSHIKMTAKYDSIGTTYNATRRADARIVDRIVALLDLPQGAGFWTWEREPDPMQGNWLSVVMG